MFSGVRQVCEHCRYNVSSNSYLLLYKEMARHVLQAHQNAQIKGDESRGLDKFLRNKPPIFKGGNDLEGAHVWLQEIEKVVFSWSY